MTDFLLVLYCSSLIHRRCWENDLDPVAGEALCKAAGLSSGAVQAEVLNESQLRQRLIQMGGPASDSN